MAHPSNKKQVKKKSNSSDAPSRRMTRLRRGAVVQSYKDPEDSDVDPIEEEEVVTKKRSREMDNKASKKKKKNAKKKARFSKKKQDTDDAVDDDDEKDEHTEAT